MYGRPNERLDFNASADRLEYMSHAPEAGFIPPVTENASNRFMLPAALKPPTPKEREYAPCKLLTPEEYEQRKRRES